MIDQTTAPTPAIEQITLSLPAGDRPALYAALDQGMQYLARVHLAIADTYPVGSLNGADHDGEADDLEGMREYWAGISARPDRQLSPAAALADEEHDA